MMKWIKWTFPVVLIGIAAALLSGWNSSHAPIDYNLLVLTLDTTRADRIGAYGNAGAATPSIDRLAREGVVFRNCRSPVPLTFPAHCSLFTGRYPIAHGVRNNGRYFLSADEETLAEIFRRAGYETHAVVAAFVLMSKFGLDQGFDSYDDSLDAHSTINDFTSEITADRVHAKFRDWFDGRGEENFFAWLHFFDPHKPYDPPDGYLAPGGRARGGWKRSAGKKDIERYDGEIAFMDSVIGQIVGDLEASGELDRTVIVVAGDHGEAFGEHEEFGHSTFCYEENLRVPLIIFNRALFPEHRSIEDPVCLTDVGPTLLDLFHLPAKETVQGRSLLPRLEGDPRTDSRTHYFESLSGKEGMSWAALTGIVHGGYKYISLPSAELYDLESDPAERTNLLLTHPEIARRMNAMLDDFVRAHSSAGPDAERALSREDRDRLAALGYASGGSPAAGGAPSAGGARTSDRGMDPKDGIKISNRLKMVSEMIKKGDLARAERVLQEMTAQGPDLPSPVAFLLLHEVYRRMGETGKDIETLKTAIRLFPAEPQFRLDLAAIFMRQERLKSAKNLCADVLLSDPANTNAHILLARIAKRRGHIGEAMRCYEQALSIEPNNRSLRKEYESMLEITTASVGWV
jgi:arylsulfatase A-like enzyme